MPPTPPTPVPPINPTDAAAFVADLTLPDRSVVALGQNVTKIWRVKNSGGTTWGSGYTLVFVGGDAMGAPTEVAVPETAPGNDVDLSMNWTIPTTLNSGTYEGTWQLRNAQGTYFGPSLYFQLQIPGTQPPPDDPNPGSAVAIELVSVTVPANVTPGQRFQVAVTVRVTQGALSEAQGDMLRFNSGENYTGFPHIGVVGSVGSGATYTFSTYAEYPFVAPNEYNTFTSVWQVWANGGWVGPLIPIQFTVYQDNRAPSNPTLLSPNDWAVSVGATPQLCAQEHGDPDGDSIAGYYFDIFDSAQLWNSGWISSNCVTPTGLGENGYQWRVKVKDSRGMESGWSDEIRHFNILSSLAQITQFDFVFPGDHPYTTRIMVCTQGGNSPGVTSYVNTANDGTDSGVWNKITDADPCPANTGGMIWDMREYAEGPHLVRIRSASNAGNIYEEKTFTVPRIVPSHPYQISPSFGFWSNSRTIHFSWQPALRATSYRLRVGAGDTPTGNPVLDTSISGTEFTYTFDQDYPRLTWDVIAINELGETGEGDIRWDNATAIIRWVGIDLVAPTTAINPANPNPVYDAQFPVTWVGADAAQSGVQAYDVQMFQQPNGPWQDWLTNYPWSSAIFTGKSGQAYCFRSRAHDIAGNVSQYPAQAEQCVTIDPTKRPQQAWWNQVWSYKRNLTISNLLPATAVPAGYTLKLHIEGAAASDIYNKSKANGDDVRVVVNDQQELERHLITFTPSAIDIAFVAQTDIPGGGNVQFYQLYYGNASAATPSVNLANIYVPTSDSGTAAVYQFEETAGDTPDLSGHGYSVVWNGSPTRDQTYGHAGQGVHLTGSEWGRVYNSVTTSDQLTAEAWVWLDTLPQEWRGIVSKANDRDVRWRLTIVNGHFQAQLWLLDQGGQFAERNLWYTAPLQTGRWYHVAMTYDGTTFQLWIDGVVVEATQVTGRVLNTYSDTDTIYIGRNNLVDSPLIGRIDGVRISNIARTAFPYAVVTADPTVAVGDELSLQTIGSSDLVLQALTTAPDGTGGQSVQATLQNQGAFPTYNEFFVHLYGDYTPTGPGDVANGIGFWVNAPIAAGQTVTLSTVLNLIGALQATGTEQTFTLAGQVDSLGMLNDTSRANNILAGPQVCLAAADTFEGDDTFAQAGPLEVGVTQQHTLHKQADADWLRFTAQAGTTYRIQTGDLGSAADTVLSLYAPDGTTVITTSDDYAGTLASQIDWIAPTSDTYFVQVAQWNPNMSGCGTSYGIYLLDQPFTDGWRGEYFNNQTLTGLPALVRFDADINFQWLDASPGPGVLSDGFSVRWTRSLFFDAGTYQFAFYHDDGARLWVDEQLIMDQWTTCCTTDLSSPIILPPGMHAVRVEMYDSTGFAAAQLTWSMVGAATPTPTDTPTGISTAVTSTPVGTTTSTAVTSTPVGTTTSTAVTSTPVGTTTSTAVTSTPVGTTTGTAVTSTPVGTTTSTAVTSTPTTAATAVTTTPAATTTALAATPTSTPLPAAPISYVIPSGGATSGTCSTWGTACNLQYALTQATEGSELWVANGIYYPDVGPGQTDNAPTATFTLPSGVALYGGFSGTETSRDQRDWIANKTILSGDLEQNDTTDANGVVVDTAQIVGTNATHVVYTMLRGPTSPVIDGFTITAGWAATGTTFDRSGGGMFNSLVAPTVSNIVFSGNRAALNGGGMYNNSSNPTLNNVRFENNRADTDGGGVYNASSSPSFINVTFQHNGALFGSGAMRNMSNSNPTLTNVSFTGNHAGGDGGALGNYDHSKPVLVNVLFSGNSTNGRGGAIYNWASSPMLTNVTLAGNWAGIEGSGMLNDGGSYPTIINSIIWGNSAPTGPQIVNASATPVITYSLIQGSGGSGNWNSSLGMDWGNNLDSDPRFSNPLAASAAPTTMGDYHLQSASPAIDRGDNTLVLVGTDRDGNPRIVGGTVDLGAYEATTSGGTWRAYFVPWITRP